MQAGTGGLRYQIAEHETVPFVGHAARYGDRPGENRTIEDKRVELAVLATGVDIGLQVGEKRPDRQGVFEGNPAVGRSGIRTCG